MWCGEVRSTECVPASEYYGRLEALGRSAQQRVEGRLRLLLRCDQVKCRSPVRRSVFFPSQGRGCSSLLTRLQRYCKDGSRWTVLVCRGRDLDPHEALLLVGWAVPRGPCWRTTGCRGPTTVARRLQWMAQRARPMQRGPRLFRAGKFHRRISESVNQAEHPSVSAPEAGWLMDGRTGGLEGYRTLGYEVATGPGRPGPSGAGSLASKRSFFFFCFSGGRAPATTDGRRCGYAAS